MVHESVRTAMDDAHMEREAISKATSSVSSSIGDLVEHSRQTPETQWSDRHSKVLRWLSPVNYEANHENACALQELGAGRWLLDSARFREWKDFSHDILWLHAIHESSGSSNGDPRTHTYCSWRWQNSPMAIVIVLRDSGGKILKGQYSSAVVNDLVAQPTKGEDSALPTIRVYFYFDFRDVEKQSVSDLLCALTHQLATQLSNIPDEVCTLHDRYKGKKSRPSSKELLTLLLEIARTYFHRVYVVIDALDECKERASLSDALRFLIQTNVLSMLITSCNKHDIERAMHIDDVPSIVIEGADIFDLLEVARRPKSIRAAQQTLPATLDETYERVLASVSSIEDRKLLRRALRLNISTRGVTILELAEMVVVEHSSAMLNRECRFSQPEDLLVRWKCLLIVTSGLVGLAHHSVQEYLLSERIADGLTSFFAINRSVAATQITRTCLKRLLRLFTASRLDQRPPDSRETPNVAQRGSQRARGYRGNALQAAAMNGDPNMVKMLLNVGARVDADGGAYGSALQAATRNGHSCAVEVLLNSGTRPNKEGGPFGYAQQAATNDGHAHTTALLLEQGAYVNAQGEAFDNTLQAAALNGRDQVVQLLLH
nr:serine/threonine-protein kinase tnni3k [Quercus suber]